MKTQTVLYFETEDYKNLKEVAYNRRVSMAEYIRQAFKEKLAKENDTSESKSK